jgi:hypothetical protein
MASGAKAFSHTNLVATAVLVLTGPHSLTGYHLFNTTSAIAYVQVFDAAAAADVTVGATTPTFVLGLPASGGATRALAKPLKFTLGIVVAATTAATGSTGASCVVQLDLTE